MKRWYGGEGIGFEPTLTEYVASLVAIFREARRVLKDDGVLWIVVADSYATRGGKWKPIAIKQIVRTTRKECQTVLTIQPLVVRRVTC